MSVSPSNNLPVIVATMREVNDCYDVFCQHAQGAGIQELPRFYQRMPISEHADTGVTFSRCELWRRYVAAMARREGNPEELRIARRLTDAQVIAVMAEQGVTV